MCECSFQVGAVKSEKRTRAGQTVGLELHIFANLVTLLRTKYFTPQPASNIIWHIETFHDIYIYIYEKTQTEMDQICHEMSSKKI